MYLLRFICIKLTSSTVLYFPLQILSLISLDIKIIKISFLSLPPLPFIGSKSNPENTDDKEQGVVVTTYH